MSYIQTVCHVTSVHGRYDTRIFYKECVSLAKAGYSVTLCVLDGRPDEVKEDISICSIHSPIIGRINRMWWVQKKLIECLLSLNMDVYHLHDPELLTIAKKLKKHGKIVIFDSHENVPLDILDKQWIPLLLRNPISKIYAKYETKIFRRIDAVVSTTTLITERVVKINPKTVQITNYPILTDQLSGKEEESFKTICFAGAVVEGWMHENIICAIETIPSVRYRLMGPCETSYLEHLQRLQGWGKVDYLGTVPFDEAMEEWACCNIGMAVYEHNNAIGGNIGTLGNTKLFEIMLAGKPVISSDLLLWKDIVEKEQCGVTVNPYSIDEIHMAIVYLLEHPDEAEKMGENGRRAAEREYNWATQEKSLINLYKSFL